MKVMHRLTPSPAMVVAMIALLVALSGSAYAAAKINGKNIKNRSVAASKIKKNTLGSNEINEAKLAAKMPKVPQAATADNAAHANAAGSLDGFVKFGSVQASNTAETEVYNSGKLRLTQECDGAGGVTLRAYTAVDNATFLSYGRSSDTNEANFDIAMNPLTVSSSDDERDAVYTDPSGQTVALQWGAAEKPNFDAGDCMVSGFAIAR